MALLVSEYKKGSFYFIFLNDIKIERVSSRCLGNKKNIIYFERYVDRKTIRVKYEKINR